MAGHGLRGARATVSGLLLLCLLWSLGSLRSDLLPNLMPFALPPLEGQALPFAMLAVVAALAGWRNGRWTRGRQMLDAALTASGLFLVPAGLMALSVPWISSMMRVVLFSLVPVFTVVFEPTLGAAARASGFAAACWRRLQR